MKRILSAFLLIVSTMAYGQTEMELWDGDLPNSNEISRNEKTLNGVTAAVSIPKLYIYFPEKEQSAGTAVIVCPGGAYAYLAMEHEGHAVARWLAEKGIVGIVLKYRMPNQHSDVPLSDAQQAIRLVRQHAKEWNVEWVGICGFSAGGHLASTVGTHFRYQKTDEEKQAVRPDFMVLVYPVVSMDTGITHQGSRENLIGKKPDDATVAYYSNETQVTENTPPTFFVLSSDDTAVPAENSIRLYQALLKNKIPTEMHCYEKGGHGFGMNKQNQPVDNWTNVLYDWMRVRGYCK